MLSNECGYILGVWTERLDDAPSRVLCLDCFLDYAGREDGEVYHVEQDARFWLATKRAHDFFPIDAEILLAYENAGVRLFCTCCQKDIVIEEEA